MQEENMSEDIVIKQFLVRVPKEIYDKIQIMALKCGHSFAREVRDILSSAADKAVSDDYLNKFYEDNF
jgi:predicted HicB family RNase H-like nuclease